MEGFINIFNKIRKNNIVNYVLSRYITYFIQFVNSILVAIYLGPIYLGIWGFLTLVIQYLGHINFGISHSANVIIAINKDKDNYLSKIIGSSVWMLFLLSLFILILFLLNMMFPIDIGEKYNFNDYAIPIYLIVVLGYFNSLFVNVFRVFSKIGEIAINQSAFPVLSLFSLLFFREKELVWALVLSNFIAYFFSLVLFLRRIPLNLDMSFNFHLIKIIQRKGWHLFVYNSSYYLIIISTRLLISVYYSVKEFGYFTFAFSLSNAILLFLDSISFLIFPKIINVFANKSNDIAVSLLRTIRDVYVTISHGLIHLAIIFFPIFISFLPQYNQTYQTFRLIALAIVLNTNSFGYQGILIAKGKEDYLGKIAFFALVINLLISFALIKICKVTYYQVIIATLVTYLLYVFIISYFGRIKLGLRVDLHYFLRDVFPLRIFIPFICSLLGGFFDLPNYMYIIPFIIFLGLNYSYLPKIKQLVISVFNNKKIIDI